jgi:glycosyltransferase involved in cell wall biosynthesis
MAGSTQHAHHDLWVVIPAYNEEQWIGKTLMALAEQEFTDFGLVVVDNGSTDRTAAVARAFAESNPHMRIDLIHEPAKGTGAAADTGMRHAITQGARWLARTDADCLPAKDWTRRIALAFQSGLRLISGRIIPRADEGVGQLRRIVLLIVLRTASLYGSLRKGNNDDPRYLGPFIVTMGSNMAITAELYELAGGFGRTKIEEAHEDRELVNKVRMITTEYGKRNDVRVYQSQRRFTAWGIRNTLAWYIGHRYKPEMVDIR